MGEAQIISVIDLPELGSELKCWSRLHNASSSSSSSGETPSAGAMRDHTKAVVREMTEANK